MCINEHRLEPEKFLAFVKLLDDTFEPEDFRDMLRRRMGWKGLLYRNIDNRFFTEMLNKAENDEKTQELLLEILKEKSESRLWSEFADSLLKKSPTDASVPPPPTSPSAQPSTEPSVDPLERKVSELHSSLEPAPWRAWMEKRERQVCRVVIQNWEKKTVKDPLY
jgi:hypothetical protein